MEIMILLVSWIAPCIWVYVDGNKRQLGANVWGWVIASLLFPILVPLAYAVYASSQKAPPLRDSSPETRKSAASAGSGHSPAHVTPRAPVSSDTAEATQCPYCKETVHPEAVKCKHCGADISRVKLNLEDFKAKGRLTPIGYIGIALGVLLLWGASATHSSDEQILFVCTGIVFLFGSYYAARRTSD